jgi:hypothetical protein
MRVILTNGKLSLPVKESDELLSQLIAINTNDILNPAHGSGWDSAAHVWIPCD